MDTSNFPHKTSSIQRHLTKKVEQATFYSKFFLYETNYNRVKTIPSALYQILSEISKKKTPNISFTTIELRGLRKGLSLKELETQKGKGSLGPHFKSSTSAHSRYFEDRLKATTVAKRMRVNIEFYAFQGKSPPDTGRLLFGDKS